MGTRSSIERVNSTLPGRSLLLGLAVVGLVFGGPSDTFAASKVERVQFVAKSVGMKRNVHVYLPDQYMKDKDARFPVVYALHGLGGTGGGFFESANLKSHMDSLIRSKKVRPVIIVAPDGDKGYWTNQLRVKGKLSKRWGDYVSKDLVAEVDSRFRTQPTREGRALVGLSMGGFGALSIGLRNQDKFHALVSMSGAIFPRPPGCAEGDRKCFGKIRKIGRRAHYRNAWGYPPDMSHWKRISPMELLGQLKPKGPHTPRIYLHCGTEDRRFHPLTKQAHLLLSEKGVAHTYRSVKGAKHNWKAWEPETPRWIKWLEQGWAESR